ncbi:phage tail protein, partial [Escherichia coli]|uniref:phage tail protein n=1 Tax=Escherichia coli TaxID=562 RepID=UPI00207BDE17
MAKNDFKAFATDRNANVMSQEEWEALPALISGFTAGKASSAQVNKVIRQASFIAAALAQFVSDKTQRDVLDNGDLPGFVELLGSGFAVEYLSRKNPFGDIKSDGTVKTALENLQLRESFTGVVGQAVNQKMSVAIASASATFTADQVIVGESLSGKQYRVSSVSETINLTTTGAGGMDTGAAPASGWVAI